MGIPETEISLLLVLYDTEGDKGERSIVVTSGLSQKTLTDALNLLPKGEGNIHPLILIISLFRYVDKYDYSLISDGIKQLEKIREDLVNIQQMRDEFKHDLKDIEKRALEQPSLKKIYFQQFANAKRNQFDWKFEQRLQRLSEKLIALKITAESVQPAVEYLMDAAENLRRAFENLRRDFDGRVVTEAQQWMHTCRQRQENVGKLAYDIGDLTREVSCPFLSRLQC